MESRLRSASKSRPIHCKQLFRGTIVLLQAMGLLLFANTFAYSSENTNVTANTLTLEESEQRGEAYVWPIPSPRAVVIAVHGATQDGACFASLAKRLNASGFSVVAMDLRGHGKWFQNHNESHLKHVVNYNKSADDLIELATEVKSAYPNTPLFCIGESVGCGVSTLAASKSPALFDGLVLASPGTSPHVFSPFMVTRDFVTGITNLNRPLNVCEYITRYSSEDPRITDEMVHDKLSRTTLTGKEILKTAAFIRKTPSSAAKLPEKMPVLILQGDRDKIVRGSTIKSIMRQIHSPDKKVVVISHCGHILLGTAYLKTPVVQPLTDWLLKESEPKVPTVAAVQAK